MKIVLVLLLVLVLGVEGCQRTTTATYVDVPPPNGSVAALPPMASALPIPSATTAPLTIGFRTGQAVEVEWHGDWWPARVLAVHAGPTYTIHYDGYDESWDEDVGLDRIRNPE